jgi:outer membrane protein assembly complex protein YaeT
MTRGSADRRQHRRHITLTFRCLHGADTMNYTRLTRPAMAILALAVALSLSVTVPLPAQDTPAAETPKTEAAGEKVVEVVVEGNQRVSADAILSQMSLRAGSVYTPAAANEDFKRIYALRQFDNVVINRETVPGGVRLRVTVSEQPILSKVEFVGAKHVKDAKLRELAGIQTDAPLDRHRLMSAVPTIADEYKRQGYYFVQVTLDEAILKKDGIARFTISEGPKVKVKAITFRGNDSISATELDGQISTKKAFWFFTAGTFSEEIMSGDVARLKAYYVGQGFFDAQVGREFTFDAKNEKVSVEFIIKEGIRYRVASIAVVGAEVRSPAYLTENLGLKPDGFYTADLLKSDTKYITDSYGRTGYVHAQVLPKVDFTAEPGKVDVVFTVTEGRKITIGDIIITGNEVTKDKVVLRELGVEPGQPADALAIKQAETRLTQTQIFKSADLSLVPTDDPDVENLAVHVLEGETAQFIIGAGVSSDSGLIGNVSLTQKNFDLMNWRGPHPFRGAGQVASIILEPGTERQQYSLALTEPNLFDLPIRMSNSVSYYTRDRDSYDEQRIGGQTSFSKPIARNWSAGLGLRLEGINIDDIDADAPQDVFKVKGNSVLSSATVSVTRDTTDSPYVPTTGSRLTFAVEQAGVMGGDYTFTRFTIDGRRYWTVTEDALGRRSVFGLKGRIGVAPGNPPIFERFYAGGRGTIRGFEYRGAGPHEGNDPIGGDFLLLAGGEYQFPIYGKNLSGVVFLDTGTVEENTSLSTFRAGAGVGLRFTVDMFGVPVPFALDFAAPLAKDKDDDTQIFSFSIDWSF